MSQTTHSSHSRITRHSTFPTHPKMSAEPSPQPAAIGEAGAGAAPAVAQDSTKKDVPLDENGQPLSKGEIKRREKEAASEFFEVGWGEGC